MLTRTQFTLLLGLLWGPFILGGLATLAGPAGPVPTLNDAHCLALLGQELLQLAIGCGFLLLVGWPLPPLQLNITVRQSLGGLLLFGLAYLLTLLGQQLAVALGADASALTTLLAQINVSWPVATLVSLVNGSFEELVLVWLIFARLGHHGTGFAVGISVLLRVLAHVYQGPVGVTGVFIFALLMALAYARYRRIWPLILAHALTDLLALLQ
ncbi:CAAX protease self-immunity [Andreprevotia lacus DSM 23236]|jgi:membrane protease YdiL (CAAX protease family)|uniref:CAAX protease self-immunity n=1 Tax=Andreprevotia lacus DSM 23236 TaxID=1121001 RepID=A0A1W1X8N5_9NEIS|nr:CPBP family intramembrane glutamic endopeptidase [Andreprevotia lacus]SMC20279.1 CAAX protease self-immunity [Andreprevotia lacus DSM 23236]